MSKVSFYNNHTVLIENERIDNVKHNYNNKLKPCVTEVVSFNQDCLPLHTGFKHCLQFCFIKTSTRKELKENNSYKLRTAFVVMREYILYCI